MMFLTLALSVMAMGSAMANDSAMDKNYKPNKVKIEINHNCCGDHGDWHNGGNKHPKMHKHLKSHRKFHRGPKLNCPICEYKANSHRPGRPHFDGKNHGGRPEGNRGNGFYGRPDGRPDGRPNGRF